MKICHIIPTGRGNWGDIALQESVRALFKKFIDTEFVIMNCREQFIESDIDKINRCDAVIVGGGGLILPTTYVNTISGWQWGISKELIEKINVPLIVYSIGWNLFHGEKNNDKILQPNLKALNEKASYISLRHTGDLKIFQNYVGSDKAVLNFCSSMTIGEYREIKTNKVAILLAKDRKDRRYKNIHRVFSELKKMVSYLQQRGYEVHGVTHVGSDSIVKKIGVPVRKIEDYKDYYDYNTVITTRGHGQMIPMGIGCNVVSLISHNKIKYFLEDINATETGVDINSNTLFEDLKRSFDIAQNFDFQDRISYVQKHIYDQMQIICSKI